MERSTQRASWSLAVVLAGLGGLLGAVGAFTTWFSATAVRQTEIFGTEVVGTADVNGTGDWTGLVAVIGGAVVGAVAVAALLLTVRALRRGAGPLAVAGGLVILAVTVAAYLRLDDVAAEILAADLDGPGVDARSSTGVGLLLSAGGGAIAAVAGVVARRTGPGASRPT